MTASAELAPATTTAGVMPDDDYRAMVRRLSAAFPPLSGQQRAEIRALVLLARAGLDVPRGEDVDSRVALLLAPDGADAT